MIVRQGRGVNHVLQHSGGRVVAGVEVGRDFLPRLPRRGVRELGLVGDEAKIRSGRGRCHSAVEGVLPILPLAHPAIASEARCLSKIERFAAMDCGCTTCSIGVPGWRQRMRKQSALSGRRLCRSRIHGHNSGHSSDQPCLPGLYHGGHIRDRREQYRRPRPAALPLFASALIGGGVIAWRKRRKQRSEPLAA